FRTVLRRKMAIAGCREADIDTMCIAAGEVLDNALTHGETTPQVRVGLAGDRFVCEISDDGPGLEDPLAGYTPPGEQAGLWIARQLTSRLDLIPREDGLTVRLWT